MVEIPWNGTRECVYTISALGQVDPKCKGCRWQRTAELPPIIE